MADPQGPVTEWDAQGKPIPAASAPTEWDATGKPITKSTTTAPQQSLNERLTSPVSDDFRKQHPILSTISDYGGGVLKGIENLPSVISGLPQQFSDIMPSYGPGGFPVPNRTGIEHAQQQAQEVAAHPAYAAGNLTGNYLAGEGAGATIGGVSRLVPKVLRGGANILAGTTPGVAEGLGVKAEAENAAATAKAAEKNTDLQTQRAADLQKHFEKTQAVREQNEAAQGVQSRKAALSRGVEQLDPKFQEDLQATEKDVRKQANEKYTAVREATAGETVPSDSLAQAVKAAESKIQGSSENLRIFRDILSKHPEGEPESVTYQGAEIPKGHPLYEVLKEGSATATTPATFSDLQGYYTELGSQLARGNLPGDVYLATKSLQESVGNLMQTMAESKGAGGLLTDARSFYRDYMNAFRDSQSPLNKAMNATERGKAIAALRTADQAGIQTLARYNPELAQRANTIRGYQAEAKALPAKAPVTKPEPTLPPKPPPAVADVKKIGLGDIQNAKQAALQKRANTLASKGALYGTLGIGVIPILRSLMHGNFETLGLEGAGIAAPYAISRALTNPKVVKWLTSPTPADVAAIPPDIRAELPQIVKQAQAQGIKVHPAIATLVGAQQALPQQ